MSGSITIKELARKIGVSTSTVSRILNGKNTRNKELVARVKEMAERYNYQVNTAALGLRTNKTKLIGIIVPEINNDFFASILSGIEQVTEQENYNLLICQSNESRSKELKLLKSLLSCNVEGVMMSISEETNDFEFMDMVRNAGKKLVFFDRIFKQDVFPNITFNDFEGAYKAGKHLIQTGRKSFLYLGVSEALTNNEDRLRGFNTALDESGFTPCKTIYARNQNVSELIKNQQDLDDVDALVCYNDIVAVEAMVGLKLRGVQVPEEIAVCGFDDRYVCQLVSPTLTSVTHHTEDLGRLAANTLLDMLNGEDIKIDDHYLDAFLVERESTTALK